MDTFPRQLTSLEAEILAFMLSPDDPRLATLRSQAEKAQVVGRYEDGCASIELSVDREGLDPSHLCSPVTESRTRGRDAATFFELLLFLDDSGWLKELEIVHYGDVTPTEFPSSTVFEPPSVRC